MNLKSYTSRQAAGLAAAGALAAVTVLAAILDRLTIAVAALGLIGGVLVIAVVQVRRRVAEAQQATRALRQEFQTSIRRADERRGELAALRQELRGVAERQHVLQRSVKSGHEQTAAAVKHLGNHLVGRQRDQTREIEALVQLFRNIEPRAPMPSSGHWALNPTDLLELWSVIDRVQPKLVLELGSGTSSTWIGYALERCHGRLISVDHDADYGAETTAQLRRHRLDGIAEVRQAPLVPVDVDGEPYEWYDPAVLSDVSNVDLLLVDGPPGDTGPRARYPALRVLEDRLSSHAAVVLDDADRRDERQIVRLWTESIAGLEREPGSVGHLAVLTYTR